MVPAILVLPSYRNNIIIAMAIGDAYIHLRYAVSTIPSLEDRSFLSVCFFIIMVI